MKVSPYLNFDGRCAAAFEFYAKCLEGKVTFGMTFGDSPMAGQVPPDWHKKLMHATLEVDDMTLMGCDAPPGRYERPQGIHVAIGLDDLVTAARIFDALAAGGTISMPLQETFWAARFGMLVDQFGIPWMINCAKPA
jgi:PhnB protein